MDQNREDYADRELPPPRTVLVFYCFVMLLVLSVCAGLAMLG